MQIWILFCGGFDLFPVGGWAAERAFCRAASNGTTKRSSGGAAECWFRCSISAIYDLQVQRRPGGGGDNSIGFGGNDSHGGDDEGAEGCSDDRGPEGVVFLFEQRFLREC